ncbi:Amt family ammonium transporter [Mycobacterium frederiksbergense]|uniref:Amt family ammonium transporter n=1 Tax=Mycolicibacterium frederiksbergense TaxID=117567 RepID=A0ABT6L6H2_9MYCO|nr:hypothetical protein [Mycolicibacterium frederiksbergense]MDH6198554.1 Amt family ammonium transporter [Mycolicibacterium frederiksbergense]
MTGAGQLLAAAFGDQVDTAAISQNFVYIVSSTAVILAVLGLVLIDAGLVRTENMLSTVIQKMVGFAIGTASFMVCGFGLWNYQYYQALGVPHGFAQSMQDWRFAGSFLSEYAQQIDPAVAPGAGNSQIFFVFLAVYGGFVCAIVHTTASERLRSAPFYVMSAVIGGVVYPILLWLTWGSTSPLTNHGVHDFVGAYTSYIFAGVFGLILTIRLKPRLGIFPKPGQPATWAPHSVPLAALGVLVLMFAAPLIVVGCGFFVPGEGYYGISMTTSGLGLVYVNVIVALAAGGIVGGALAYYARNPVHALLGPISGYVTGTAGFDVLKPWEMFLIALLGPLVVGAVYAWVNRRRIDDGKVFPLACATAVGCLVVGVVAWGTPTGGYFGLTGDYGFQHAKIDLWWQLVGLGATVAIAVAAALVLVVGLGNVMRLRVSEHDEATGIDAARWRPKASAYVPPEHALQPSS